jgi:hypothetical protein
MLDAFGLQKFDTSNVGACRACKEWTARMI